MSQLPPFTIEMMGADLQTLRAFNDFNETTLPGNASPPTYLNSAIETCLTERTTQSCNSPLSYRTAQSESDDKASGSQEDKTDIPFSNKLKGECAHHASKEFLHETSQEDALARITDLRGPTDEELSGATLHNENLKVYDSKMGLGCTPTLQEIDTAVILGGSPLCVPGVPLICESTRSPCNLKKQSTRSASDLLILDFSQEKPFATIEKNSYCFSDGVINCDLLDSIENIDSSIAQTCESATYSESIPPNSQKQSKQDTAELTVSSSTIIHPETTEQKQVIHSLLDDPSYEIRTDCSLRDSSEVCPVGRISECCFENLEKRHIYILYDGKVCPVGWDADAEPSDIRDMVFCACDAMMNSGFILRELLLSSDLLISLKTMNEFTYSTLTCLNLFSEENESILFSLGRSYEYEDFHLLKSNEFYKLLPAKERQDLKSLCGDRMRQWQIKIDAMLHAESSTAINVMKKGTNFLKHTAYGPPHLRRYQLSSDAERLVCFDMNGHLLYSIDTNNIHSIRLKQRSFLFSQHELLSLEALSFSIYYDSSGLFRESRLFKYFPLLSNIVLSSLHLTCKDQEEFDQWVCGLKALIYHKQNVPLSKEELLCHSKLYSKPPKSTQSKTSSTSPTICSTIHYSSQTETSQMNLGEKKRPSLQGLFSMQEKLSHLTRMLYALQRNARHVSQQGPHGDKPPSTLLAHNDQTSLPYEAKRPTLNSTHLASFSSLPDSNSLASNCVYNVSRPMEPLSEDDSVKYRAMHELILSVKSSLNRCNQILVQSQAASSQATTQGVETDYLNDATQLLWSAEEELIQLLDMYERLAQRRHPIEFLRQSWEQLTQLSFHPELKRWGERMASTMFSSISPFLL